MEKSEGSIVNTKKIAKQLAHILKKGDVVFLYGNLGAGKTTFTKLVLENLGYKSNVQSPTFVLERNYKVKDYNFHHIDLYRIKKSDFSLLEFLNEKDKNGVYFIEWPEVIEGIIKPDYRVYLSVIAEKLREIKVEYV